jgi:Cu(I)/Ag(I) efflux system membrane fusion protein
MMQPEAGKGIPGHRPEREPPKAAPQAPPVAVKAPAAFQAQLGKLVGGYLAVGAALAGDDAAKAAQGVAAARQALDAIDMKLLDAAAHAVWMKELPSLQAAVGALAKAKGIQEQREGFALLSEALAAAAKSFAIAPARTLYILHCPMAFKNRGADWLQADQTVANPYFGAEMLRCGEVTGRVEGQGPRAE